MQIEQVKVKYVKFDSVKLLLSKCVHLASYSHSQQKYLSSIFMNANRPFSCKIMILDQDSNESMNNKHCLNFSISTVLLVKLDVGFSSGIVKSLALNTECSGQD